MEMSEKNKDKISLGVVIGVLAFFLLIFFICSSVLFSLANGEMEGEEGIGVVEIKGTIESADQTVRNIQAFKEDERVRAVLVRIDSPGGSVSASQEMVEAIQSIDKPVIISMGDMAASGGYYVACAGPEIYANPGTLTGSIGVISQVVNFKELMEIVKVNVHTVKTGELKDAGSPFRDFNETDEAFFRALGLEILDQFVSHVADARKMSKEQVMALADGRVWSGREAKTLGLIDELGGMNTAIEALRKKAGLSGNVKLIYPKSDSNEWISALLAEGASGAFSGLKASAENAIQKKETFQYLYQQ